MALNPQIRMLHLMKDVKPSLRLAAGEDFASWQTRARARLGELLGLDAVLEGLGPDPQGRLVRLL